MHFVDAWTSLTPFELALRAGPAALMLGVVLLPGRAGPPSRPEVARPSVARRGRARRGKLA